MRKKTPSESFLKLEKEKLEYQRMKEESAQELEKRRKEIEKLEREVERSKQELEVAETYSEGRNFQQILNESGLKDIAIIKRLHMTTPTFTARKHGGASLWRMDEVKTMARRLNINPITLAAALLPEVNIIPEDKEEARKLRKSYSKNILEDEEEGEVKKKKRGPGRPRKNDK